MTKEEILAKVQATIAGQGNEVDLGGALPAILSAIVELIPGKENFIPEIPLIEGKIGELTPEQFAEMRSSWAVRYNGQILPRITGCLNTKVNMEATPTLGSVLSTIFEDRLLDTGVVDVFGVINYAGDEDVLNNYSVLALNGNYQYIYAEL